MCYRRVNVFQTANVMDINVSQHLLSFQTGAYKFKEFLDQSQRDVLRHKNKKNAMNKSFDLLKTSL